MTTDLQPKELREQVAAHLDSLQQLTERRNALLGLAACDRRPAVRRALLANREALDATRRALRLIRTHLAQAERGDERTDQPRH